ncbi:hypothetical protein [Lichenifustis flavocetrariae]|uniref:Uncharacterized protein n=1 Tax=Lichenifustis flavocetrariae TaxID=2949735 RepID=A0AA41ZAU6_9HYPH|nr:hypothetical protein [Lichenifustis flavocetrariae]MCW6512492.1 hypothetical protein [Lichenifustis flavocetrariae]
MFKTFDRGRHARAVDELRPGLIAMFISRMRAFNANTQRLLRLLEEPDWNDLAAVVMRRVRG